jgi:hypothetical protein
MRCSKRSGLRGPGRREIQINWQCCNLEPPLPLVNDGKTTKLYINGSEDVRNSHDLSTGLETVGGFWMVGATQYGHTVGPALYGWLGDVRIVNRPLSVREFMISRDGGVH